MRNPTHLQRQLAGIGLILLTLLIGCDVPAWLPTGTPTPTATLWPTFTPVPVTPTPRPADTGWEPVARGLEVRSLDVAVGEDTERVTLARVDPATVRFRVLYDPDAPVSVRAWALQSDADLVINAGYFHDDHTTVGLTISEGVAHGSPYGDYAGMFAVTANEQVSVRWLRVWPYQPAESLRAAVQSFPILVKPGGILGFTAASDDGRAARRSVVGQDTVGRILFAVAPEGAFTLHELSRWLTHADLGLNVAVNLDGGTSSGLWVKGATAIDSLIAVPAVIVADLR